MTTRLRRFALASSAALAFASPLLAQFQMPPNFEAVQVSGTFSLPVGLAFAPNGTMFLILKTGVVRVLDPAGAVQAANFIDLRSEVNNDHDRGMLGIALNPGFVADGGPTSWVYLLYTVTPTPPSDNSFNGNQQYSFSRLTRYRAVTNAGLVQADAASRQVLLGNQLADGSVPDCIASLHNSHSNGSLQFADDGTLLLTTGDGAHYDFQDNGGADNAGFDTFTHPTTGKKGPTPKVQDEGAFRAQDLRSLAGKVLRLDPETGFGLPSNPFYDGNPASHRSRVWALGLRNPFRMELVPGTGATDPTLGQPNVVVLGDVGWDTWEEVNVSAAGGENFGWPCFEGPNPHGGYQAFASGDPNKVTCQTPVAGVVTPPALAWHHGAGNLLYPPNVYVDGNGNPIPAGFIGNCAVGGAIAAGGGYPLAYQGRMFFADYVHGYIKTIEFDPAFNLLKVRDFASNAFGVVELRRHPLTGELHFIQINAGRLYRIRYSGNQTPIAAAAASPLTGPAPLQVAFDGSASSDPNGDALSFLWEFGDGTPNSNEPSPQHVYAAAGLYTATLTVTDALGLFDQDVVQIGVGNAPPTATIATPTMGQIFQTPTDLALTGAGTDPEGLPLSFDWSITLYHGNHTHPGTFVAAGPQATFSIGVSPEDPELLYYEVILTVTDAGGLSDSEHVFVFPAGNVIDPAGSALPIARVDAFGGPSGGGNHDVEVIRDGELESPGSADDAAQFDTYTGGQQGGDDWIGYELQAPGGPEFRFAGLSFQEGKHFFDGGWFQDFRVEVRKAGVWTAAANLHVTPAYPFAFSGQQFFDGVGFQTYDLWFDPLEGDAVRLRGTPGGSAGFISVGELRVRALAATPYQPYADLTAEGTIVANVFSLSPPFPTGAGNLDPETIRNGTFPPAGSASFHAQYDTFHGGTPSGFDWLGYEFPGLRTFARVVFQEGRNNPDGGAFAQLAVEVQASAGGPWTPVAGLAAAPSYSGLNGLSYETFTLDFVPVAGRAIRIGGPPAGSNAYVSAGELRVYGPALPEGCGATTYGAGLPGANTLELVAEIPRALGLPASLLASGAGANTAGYLAIAPAQASVAAFGGTLLLSPSALALLPLSYDAAGKARVAAPVAANPALHGTAVYVQALALAQPAPFPVRFSNGIAIALCDW